MKSFPGSSAVRWDAPQITARYFSSRPGETFHRDYRNSSPKPSKSPVSQTRQRFSAEILELRRERRRADGNANRSKFHRTRSYRSREKMRNCRFDRSVSAAFVSQAGRRNLRKITAIRCNDARTRACNRCGRPATSNFFHPRVCSGRVNFHRLSSKRITIRPSLV